MAESRLDKVEKTLAQVVTWMNGVITNAKTVGDLDAATLPPLPADLLPIAQGGVLKKITYGDMPSGSGIKYVEQFEATADQTTHTVAQAAIANDGKWSIQVGAELWNSTTGITGVADGNLTITFATGQITFLIPLNEGTQVIIKHN